MGGKKRIPGAGCTCSTYYWSYEHIGHSTLKILGMKSNDELFKQLDLIFWEEWLAEEWCGIVTRKQGDNPLCIASWQDMKVEERLLYLLSLPARFSPCLHEKAVRRQRTFSPLIQRTCDAQYTVRICDGSVSHRKTSQILTEDEPSCDTL